MQWSDVTGWVGQGGAFLGTKRTLPGERMPFIASRLKELKIQALLIIGGFEVRKLDICTLQLPIYSNTSRYSILAINTLGWCTDGLVAIEFEIM